jgi:hypothetical protein
MTRRPQKINVGDEVFASYESSTADWIVGGIVQGFATGGGIIGELPYTQVYIRLTKMYSVTYKTHMDLSPGSNTSDLIPIISVPESQVRHINDVRFLKR